MFAVDCSKLTAQQRALLRAFAETEKDVEGTVRTFEGEIFFAISASLTCVFKATVAVQVILPW